MWHFKGVIKKNQFPTNSIMGKYEIKQIENELADIIAKTYISEELAWSAILPSQFDN